MYGIMILSEDTINGTDMHEALDWQGAQIDFKILANRPDCLSVIGLAGERRGVRRTLQDARGAGGRDLPEDIHNIAKVQVEAPGPVPRYMARVVRTSRSRPRPLDAPGADRSGHAPDQQHRGHHQLCDAGDGPAHARIRPGHRGGRTPSWCAGPRRGEADQPGPRRAGPDRPDGGHRRPDPCGWVWPG